MSKIKISVKDELENIKKISWPGLPVGGTEGIFAITRPPLARYTRSGKKRFVPNETLWSITHLPTGYGISRLAAADLAIVRKRAKRLFPILKKHGIHDSKDAATFACVKVDFERICA